LMSQNCQGVRPAMLASVITTSALSPSTVAWYSSEQRDWLLLCLPTMPPAPVSEMTKGLFGYVVAHQVTRSVQVFLMPDAGPLHQPG